jgi:general secretion pathway protein A
MNKKLLSLYGLKWNPFAPDVPIEALVSTPKIDNFCWRIESLARCCRSGYVMAFRSD